MTALVGLLTAAVTAIVLAALGHILLGVIIAAVLAPSPCSFLPGRQSGASEPLTSQSLHATPLPGQPPR